MLGANYCVKGFVNRFIESDGELLVQDAHSIRIEDQRVKFRFGGSPRAVTMQLIDGRAEIFGQGGFDGHWLAIGVNEGELLRVEREAADERAFVLAAVGAVVALEAGEEEGGTCRIVEGIDGQGEADGCQVNADLVGLAGLGEDSQERVMTKTLFDLPLGERGPAVLGNVHAVAGGVRREASVDGSIGGRGAAGDQGEVFLFDGVVLELVREVALGGKIFGEEEDAGGVFVETVDDSDAWVVGPRVGETKLSGQLLQDGSGFAAAGDGGKSRGLVDRD